MPPLYYGLVPLPPLSRGPGPKLDNPNRTDLDRTYLSPTGNKLPRSPPVVERLPTPDIPKECPSPYLLLYNPHRTADSRENSFPVPFLLKIERPKALRSSTPSFYWSSAPLYYGLAPTSRSRPPPLQRSSARVPPTPRAPTYITRALYSMAT